MLNRRLLILIAVLLALPSLAHAKPARCFIQSGNAKYAGPCQFHSEKGGSFWLDPPPGRKALLYVTSLSVTMRGDGTAEVRGLTPSGVSSMWGTVRRSRKDPACWVGLDLKICAY